MEQRKIVKSKSWMAVNRALRAELKAAGLEDEDARRELYRSWIGKESASDMTVAEIASVAHQLRTLRQGESDISKQRKRVIAAVCKYLAANDNRFSALSGAERVAKAKAVATRAAKAKSFNAIPETKLRGIYNAFLRMGRQWTVQ